MKISVNAENSVDAHELCDAERADETSTAVSPNLLEERIKSNLEPRNAQISILSQLLNQLIQDNSARDSLTAGPRTHQRQSRHLLSGEVGNL